MNGRFIAINSVKFRAFKRSICLRFRPKVSLFLIEVKDYRHPETAKPSQLPQVFASKVCGTLAAFLPARLHANDPSEKALAAKILKCKSLQVVFHIEQNRRWQSEFIADIKMKTKELLKAIDSNPKFVHMGAMQNVSWTVSQSSQVRG